MTPRQDFPRSLLYIGLMSGTSLDGVDGVLVEISGDHGQVLRPLSAAHIPFEAALRADLLALQSDGPREIHHEALAANALAVRYAACVARLLANAGTDAAAVRAVAVHGQTIRHRPELGYTRQTNNPALLAELCGIDVIADFRSREVAAGGQGAPLVPAFHRAVFGDPHENRVVLNIGGISNISILPAAGAMSGASGTAPAGFDTGPGNVLLDGWAARHLGRDFDDNGDWGRSGTVDEALLKTLLAAPYFRQSPPKSTGRDLFDMAWLDGLLAQSSTTAAPADIQATLVALTAHSIARDIHAWAPQAGAVYVCGGGARNGELMRQLQGALNQDGRSIKLDSTAALGIPPDQVEALAFAWLGQRFTERQPGNLPAVTGARGPRVLGALYPA